MRSMGHGKAYRYDHDEPNAFSVGQTYFPEKMGERTYYEPVTRGLEARIQEKLKQLKALPKTEEKSWLFFRRKWRKLFYFEEFIEFGNNQDFFDICVTVDDPNIGFITTAIVA